MERAKSVISEDEMEHFYNLGLGRGVDATIPFPWKNKRSFQVRSVKFEDIMGTEECGAYQNYTSTVASSTESKVNLKASLSLLHTPVSLGLDSEVSRSSCHTRKTVGTRVINRTVSFRKEGGENIPLRVLSDESIPLKNNETFEEFVSEWISKRIKKREKFGILSMQSQDATTVGEKGTEPIQELHDYTSKASKEERKIILGDCDNLIRFFGITHYVSSITLGAMEYQVLTEQDYDNLVSMGANISAMSMATVGGKVSSKRSQSKKTNLTHQIGKIRDQRAARGTYDEAVIEIKIQSILPLIQENYLLQLAFHKVIEDYIEDSINDSMGPYVIECGDNRLYWKVDEDNVLTITKDFKEASALSIIPCHDTSDQHDFSIGWNGMIMKDCIKDEEQLLEKKVHHTSITRYLEATSSFFGNNPGPLKMKSGFNFNNSQLYLYNQLRTGFFEHKADIDRWIENKGVFFISNRYKGFLCMSSTAEGDRYTCRCVSSRSVHNEKDHFMLFRLHSTWKNIHKYKRQQYDEGLYKDELSKLFDP